MFVVIERLLRFKNTVCENIAINNNKILVGYRFFFYDPNDVMLYREHSCHLVVNSISMCTLQLCIECSLVQISEMNIYILCIHTHTHTHTVYVFK